MEPIDHVQLIKRSMRCFLCGLVGILPVVGIPFAVVALGDCFYVARRKDTKANPAERYLRWGALGATMGLGLTALTAGIVLIELSWVR